MEKNILEIKEYFEEYTGKELNTIGDIVNVTQEVFKEHVYLFLIEDSYHGMADGLEEDILNLPIKKEIYDYTSEDYNQENQEEFEHFIDQTNDMIKNLEKDLTEDDKDYIQEEAQRLGLDADDYKDI